MSSAPETPPFKGGEECATPKLDTHTNTYKNVKMVKRAYKYRFYQVLAGRLRCTRGESHKVAVMLGLKAGVIVDTKNLPFGKKESD